MIKRHFFYFLGSILLLFSFGSNAIKAQSSASASASASFEGIIVYDMLYEDRLGLLTKEQAKLFLGDQYTYTVKGNHYKSEMNGLLLTTQYYLGGDTLYTHTKNTSSLTWNDVRQNGDSLIRVETQTNADTIQGFICDRLSIYSKKGVYHYYYNTQFALNPSDYAHHAFGFSDVFVSKTKSLPLKIVTDTKEAYSVSIAKHIEAKKIDDSVFNYPNQLRRVANSYK